MMHTTASDFAICLVCLFLIIQVPLQHWTVAVLFSRVSVDVIIKCVNILLLEQSLVIVGEDLGLVSSIGTALTSLLAPFKWDGVFIPVLPDGLNDILQSPVPFVLGVSPPFDPSRVPNASVLYIGRTKEYLRVPQMETKLPLCYQHLQVSPPSLFWYHFYICLYTASLTKYATNRNCMTQERSSWVEDQNGLTCTSVLT